MHSKGDFLWLGLQGVLTCHPHAYSLHGSYATVERYRAVHCSRGLLNWGATLYSTVQYITVSLDPMCKGRQSMSRPGTSPFVLSYPCGWWDSVRQAPRYPRDWWNSVLPGSQVP